MKKPLIVGAAAAAALAALYLGTARHVGGAIEAEVAQFETALARLDEVLVYRLSYERRLFDGTLHYDLVLRAAPEGPLQQALRDLVGDAAEAGIRIAGSAAVRHGPWIGGGTGLALARIEGSQPLPEALRAVLPQYPGQRPMLETVAVLGFDRKIDARLRGIDYRGKLVDSTSALNGDVAFAGLNGRLGFDAGADWFDAELRLDEIGLALSAPERIRGTLKGVRIEAKLARTADGLWTGPALAEMGEVLLGADDFTMSVSGLTLDGTTRAARGADGQTKPGLKGTASLASASFSATTPKVAQLRTDRFHVQLDAIQEWPNIWTGEAEVRLAQLEARDGQSTATLSDLGVRTVSQRKGELVDQWAEYGIGPVTFNTLQFGGGRMKVRLDGLRGDALDTLVAAAQRLTPGEALGQPEFQAVLQASAQQLLTERLSLDFDPVGLHVQKPDDIAARAGISFAGDPDIQFDNPAALLDRLEAYAGISADPGALRELIRIAVEAERSQAGTAGTEDVTGETDARFTLLMAAVRQSPFLIVNDAGIRGDATFRSGRLEVNGVDVGGLDTLASLGGLGGLFGSADRLPTQVPNADAEPLFETIRLKADFTPDPYQIELLAGGSSEVPAGLGDDCVGHVSADQPDVVLDYEAGPYRLFIYAESDEDVSLIVRAPDGNWHCNDDGPDRGLDPTLEFPIPEPGRYRIWVGTVGAAPAKATLSLSEIDPAE